MTKKRFINDVTDIYDTKYGYMGDKAPTKREIKEMDYLLIGIGKQQDDAEDICKKLNEFHDENMNLRWENTRLKLTLKEIIRDMQKIVDEDQMVYINQSYVDWIKKEVDLEFNARKEKKGGEND